ncbi:hypothetical protein P20480_2007 [Pseudoalteromonas sp. BSi20480]|nr:hypothetical protein P20480_2007 [Pseudoalteromonas sp. BSi20480]
MTQQPHNYSISTDKSKLNYNVIYNFIANSYWAKGIPKSVMQKAIDNQCALACIALITSKLVLHG